MNVASVSIMSLSLCYILQGLKPYTCCQSWLLLSLIVSLDVNSSLWLYEIPWVC